MSDIVSATIVQDTDLMVLVNVSPSPDILYSNLSSTVRCLKSFLVSGRILLVFSMMNFACCTSCLLG